MHPAPSRRGKSPHIQRHEWFVAALPESGAVRALLEGVLFPEQQEQQAITGQRESYRILLRSRLAQYLEKLKRMATPGDGGFIRRRRQFVGFWISGFLLTNFVMFLRFFFPRVIYEPNTRFKIGGPSDFSIGVDTRYKNDHRIWVVRTPDRLFVIFARCTHLGCTPNWMESEQKFKCPCHGSGYDPEGINFEGPAPRPMDRAKVELDPEGEIVVDTAVLFKRERGKENQFNDHDAYLPV